MNLLNEIVAHKRLEVEERKRGLPREVLEERARRRPSVPAFRAGLRPGRIGLIAEVKRRSPSAGLIRKGLDPAATARSYERAGAAAVSVLMDARYFGGGEDDFISVRSAVGLPLLYKEFVVDGWQVWHAASLGATVILLIAAVLDEKTLAALLEECRRAGLESLVEVHNARELEAVSGMGMDLVGINNRDLRTFRVDVGTTFSLLSKVPAECAVVSESGIKDAETVVRLQEAGVAAVLVGEQLLKGDDTGEAVEKLMGTAWGRS